MSLIASRLHHRFPERKRDIGALLHTCQLVQLTDEELQHLCGSLLRKPQLLDAFLREKQKSEAEAEKYVLSQIPPHRYCNRTEQKGFNIFYGWVARLLS